MVSLIVMPNLLSQDPHASIPVLYPTNSKAYAKRTAARRLLFAGALFCLSIRLSPCCDYFRCAPHRDPAHQFAKASAEAPDCSHQALAQLDQPSLPRQSLQPRHAPPSKADWPLAAIPAPTSAWRSAQSHWYHRCHLCRFRCFQLMLPQWLPERLHRRVERRTREQGGDARDLPATASLQRHKIRCRSRHLANRHASQTTGDFFLRCYHCLLRRHCHRCCR